MNQSKPNVRPLSRALRIWLELRDERGRETSYKVFPRKPTPAQAAAVRLLKWENDAAVECYDLVMDNDGAITCTCPGFVHHKHCKHADAMKASSILLAEERKLLTESAVLLMQVRNDAEAQVAELNWQLSAARRDLEAAQAEINSLRTELASRPARSARKTQSLRRSHKKTLAAHAAEESGVANVA